MSLIIDGMDQAKCSLPHLTRNTHKMQGKLQMGMKLTGVLVAGAPIPCFAYLNSEHYGGSSNLTCTILMDVLRRQAAKIRETAAEMGSKGLNPTVDPHVQAALARAAAVNEQLDELQKSMGIQPMARNNVNVLGADTETVTETVTSSMADMCQDDDDSDDDDDDDDLADGSKTQATSTKVAPESAAMKKPLETDDILEQCMNEAKEERRNRTKIDLSKEMIATWPERLYVQLDNSGKDNKNSIVLLFLALLVYFGVFKVVSHYLMNSFHTFIHFFVRTVLIINVFAALGQGRIYDGRPYA